MPLSMKKFIWSLFSLFVINDFSFAQGTGIGTLNPDNSAILHVNEPDNNRGILFPRANTGQVVGITSPKDGLLSYDVTAHQLAYFKDNVWQYITSWDTEVIATADNNNQVDYILTNRKVGIGINREPTHNLEVNGTMTATEFSGLGMVPLGGIIMWSGNTIPSDYRLCDGNGGRPDLRDRFILAGRETTIGNSGNENTSTLIDIDHGVIFGADRVSNVPTSDDNRPAFYQLAFIMRIR